MQYKKIFKIFDLFEERKGYLNVKYKKLSYTHMYSHMFQEIFLSTFLHELFINTIVYIFFTITLHIMPLL